MDKFRIGKIKNMHCWLAVLLLAGVAACSLTPTEIPPNQMTRIVQDILDSPGEFEGKEVVVVGYYRGWDLLDEAGAPSPVTRSDWVIRDESGAIYVLAGTGGEVTLDPGSMEDIDKVVRVVGVVRLTAENQPYLEAMQVELVT